MFLQSILCVSTLVVVKSSQVPYAFRGEPHNANAGSSLGLLDTGNNFGRSNVAIDFFPNQNLSPFNVGQGETPVNPRPTFQGGDSFLNEGQTFVEQDVQLGNFVSTSGAGVSVNLQPLQTSQSGSSTTFNFNRGQPQTSATATSPSGSQTGTDANPVTAVRFPGTLFSPEQLQSFVLTSVRTSSEALPFRIRVADMSRMTVQDTQTVFNIITDTVTLESTVTSRTTLISPVVHTVHETVTVHTQPDDRLALPEVTTTKFVESTVTDIVLDPHITTLNSFVISTLPTVLTTIIPITSLATRVITNTFYSTSTTTRVTTERPETIVHTITVSTYAPYVPTAYH